MKTLKEQFTEQVKDDAKALTHYEESTPKHRLVILRDHGLLTDIQVRAVARRIDAARKEGKSPEEAFDAALAVFEKGELKVGAVDKKAKENLPSLKEIQKLHPGASAKQILLELRDAGSISPQQTKDAARAVAKKMSVEQALAEAGAEHVLDVVPPKPDEEEEDGKEKAPEGGQDEGEADEPKADEDEDPKGEDEATEPAPKSPEDIKNEKKARTLEGVLDQPIREIEGDIEKVKSKQAMIQLVVFETFGKTRSTLIPLLVERAKELGATDEDIESAIKIARQEQDGGTVEEAYRDIEEA